MIKIDKQHHKIIRTSPAWGDWEYEYHERHQQLQKAQELISRSTGEENQHGK